MNSLFFLIQQIVPLLSLNSYQFLNKNFRIFKKMKSKHHILPEILSKNLDAIQDLCRRHKIKYLYALGSVLMDRFREESDIDLIHDWDRANISDEEYLDNHDGFIEALGKLLGRKIDFVHYPSLKNPYFIEEIDETKVLLYEQKDLTELRSRVTLFES